ncbi:disks large-associated protein 5 isoform X2 [Microcaecilia unicolor]|uniref:Disks large-associated protein 5 isoform X2 n=1 Tax=Microcaecilia unicolor TaxID=1415580 RepID=A0A6P7Z2P0_9AMPH|nr:disks large-associated protein 5 isoform X2 [Microcaecilia unicolor]
MMDVKSQFVNRYKRDLSTETFRAKIARRKSLSQKENRHKEFRKSRGLPLHDLNISPFKENDISQLEQTETLLPTLEETKENTFTSAQQVVKQRRDLLQRFKEEKQLRKLKEQREKAKQSVFKCGLYKPDVACFLPGPYAVQAKQREKGCLQPAPSAIARVTRSMAKNPAEQAVKIPTRSQNSVTIAKTTTKGNGDHTVRSGHKHPTAARKETDKGKVFPTVTHTRTTRATIDAMTKQLPKVIGTQIQRKAAPKEKQQKTGKTESVQKHSHKPFENILISQINEGSDECKNILSHRLHDSVEEKENFSVNNMPLPFDEGKGSFAPPNFVFQPLNGLSSYKVKPMTPHRANAFLTPCFTWSPVKISNNPVEEITSPVKTEATSVFHFSPDKQNTDLDNQELTMCAGSLLVLEKDLTAEIKVPVCSGLPVSEMILKPSIKENKIMSEELSHDVPYFRGTLCSESKRLMSLCVEWEEKLELDIPEDAKSLIRTTVGQTRLLMMERFKQFEGLVDDCEFKRGEKDTTCTDLDGFWDMVSFQINDVDKKFDNLIKLQENNWQYNMTQTRKVIKKKVVSVPTSKSNQDIGRAAARNRLAAVKAAMKCKKQQEERTETAAPETSKEVEKVVFDAGFFRIESPVKPAPGSSSKMRFSASSQRATPKSILKTLSQSKMVSIHAAERAAKTEKNIGALQVPEELLSSARKVLFGNTVEPSATTTEDEDCPMVEDTELVTASNEINLTLEKYFVPLEACRSNPIVSDKVEAFDVKTSERIAGGAEFTTDVIMQDDVMASPQKTTESLEVFFPLETLRKHETEILSTKLISSDVSSCEPADFFKCSTSPEVRGVNHGMQLKSGDLIVFSPFANPD